MNKKKVSAKYIKILINLISLIIFAVSYFYIYSDYENKTKAVNNEVSKIRQDIENQKQKLKEEALLRKSMEKINSKKQAIMDTYPVKIAKEDDFMFVKDLEEALNISFSSINITDSVPVYRTILPSRNKTKAANAVIKGGQNLLASAGLGKTDNANAAGNVPNTNNSATNTNNTAANSNNTAGNTNNTAANTNNTAANTDNAATNTNNAAANADNSAGASGDMTALLQDNGNTDTMTGMQSTINLAFSTKYENFKKLVNYIVKYPDKSVVDSASINYDKSKKELTGSIIIKRFALTGTGKVYKPPYIRGIQIGTDNLCKTNNR